MDDMKLIAGLRDQVSAPNPRVLAESRAALIHHTAAAPARPDRRRPARRRLALAAALTASAAAITAGALAWPTQPAHGPQAKLAAWTVRSNPNGTVTLTIDVSRLFDPQDLERALAKAGVPAVIRVVRFNQPCQPGGMTDRQLRQYTRVLREGPPGPEDTFIITPAAMPKGYALYFVAERTSGVNPSAGISYQSMGFTSSLLPQGTPLTCDQANPSGPATGSGS